MKFVDELPAGERFSSKLAIEELKKHPGKWGNFYTQEEGDTKEQVQGKAQALRSYAKRHDLPVTVRTLTESGKIQAWGRWSDKGEARDEG